MAGAAGALAVVALALLLGPTRPAATVARPPDAPPSPWSLSGCTHQTPTSPGCGRAWFGSPTMRLSGSGGDDCHRAGAGARRLARRAATTAWSRNRRPRRLRRFAKAGRRRADRARERDGNGGSPRAGRLDRRRDRRPYRRLEATIEGPADSLAFLVDLGRVRSCWGLLPGVEGDRLMSLEGADQSRAHRARRASPRRRPTAILSWVGGVCGSWVYPRA